MAKKSKESNLSVKERLDQTLLPNWDEPYKLPKNWCWVRVDAISSIYTGNSINERVKEEKYAGRPDGLVYLATKDIGFDSTVDYETNIRIPQTEGFKVARKNATLLCIEGGSAGRKIGFITQDVCFVNKLCAFTPLGSMNPKYLFYVIQSDSFKEQFNAKKHGLIGGVSVKEISSIYIPVAPIEQQNRIVETIESLFNKLEEAKEKACEVADGFETRKAAILHKAFSGQLTEKWREENGVGIDSWERLKLGEIGTLERGRSQHRPRNDPRLFGGPYPFIQTGDVASANVYIMEHRQTLSEFGMEQSRLFPAGTLCITIAANIGDVAILSYDCCFPDSVVGFTPNNRSISKFIYYSMSVLQKELEDNAPAVAQKNINLKILNAVEVNVPSIREQTEIVNILDSLFSKEQQSKDLAEAVVEQIDVMKNAILARAFRGKLCANDFTEEAATELVKKILGTDMSSQIAPEKSSKRILIPANIRALISNVREEEIVRLLLKSESKTASVQSVMTLSSKKFELMEALRTLEKKQIIEKNEFGEYSLKR